jgi:hypothetical protein
LRQSSLQKAADAACGTAAAYGRSKLRSGTQSAADPAQRRIFRPRQRTAGAAGDRTRQHAERTKRRSCHRTLSDPRQRARHRRRGLLRKIADRAGDVAQSLFEGVEEPLEVFSGKARAIDLLDQRIDLLVGQFGESGRQVFTQGGIVRPLSVHGMNPSTSSAAPVVVRS